MSNPIDPSKRGYQVNNNQPDSKKSSAEEPEESNIEPEVLPETNFVDANEMLGAMDLQGKQIRFSSIVQGTIADESITGHINDFVNQFPPGKFDSDLNLIENVGLHEGLSANIMKNIKIDTFLNMNQGISAINHG